MVDTLSILYHFEAHFGGQRMRVLELQRLDCQFGSSFGVLHSVQFEVSRRHMGCEGLFGKFKVSKTSIVERPHRVYTLFSPYKVAFVNMND